MKIWEVRDETGGTICFKATKKEAEAERDWWWEREQIVEIAPCVFAPTRDGIAKLLTVYAGGAGE